MMPTVPRVTTARSVLPSAHSELEFLRALSADALANNDPYTPSDSPTGGMSQADLERVTRLSRPSVLNLIRRFESVLVPQSNGGTGRVALDPTAGVAIGIDFGHGHTSVAITDLYGRFIAAAEIEVDDPAARGAPQIDWAAVEIERLLAATAYDARRVAGVAIALPGPVDRNDAYAVIRAATSIGTAFQNPFQTLRPAVHLKESLVKRTLDWRKVPFFVDNDANLSALAERTWGLARAARNVIYVDWSSGIGGGLVLNGALYRGNGAAGEIGHIVVADAVERGSLAPCQRCGNRGCLESLISFDALYSELQSALQESDDSDRPAALLSLAQNDGPAKEALQRAADYLTRALAPLITALNPELVIIGGGFGTRAYDVIKNDLLDKLDERTMPPANKDVTVLGAIAPPVERLPKALRRAARRTALAGAAAAVINPDGTDLDTLITYLQSKVLSPQTTRGTS